MDLTLPLEVTSPADINRLLRELKLLEDFFIKQSAQRSAGAPRTSELLSKLVAENSLDVSKDKDRAQLRHSLELLSKKAPLINISFASEPSAAVINKILGWLRDNIHPRTLIEIGLQPSIAAGCILRTPNKVFDLSLRHHLESQNPYLVELIQGAVSARR